MKKKIIIGFCLLLSGCKGADLAQFESLGSRHKITCYSAGVIIYKGESTGNISNEAHSDGIYWKDAKTGLLIESTVPCLIEQEP